MNFVNYHKLVNLKKTIEKLQDREGGGEIIKKLIDLIDVELIAELEISKQKDKERRMNYKQEIVKCEFCEKEMFRNSIYKHKKICAITVQNTP
jgi:hypothetical protein